MAPTKGTGVKKVLSAKSKPARYSIKRGKSKFKQFTVAGRTRGSLRLSKRGGGVKTEVEHEHSTVKQEDTIQVEAEVKPDIKKFKEDDEVKKPIIAKKEPKYKASKSTAKVPTKQTSNDKPETPVKFKSLDIEEAMHEFANKSLKGDLNKAVEAALMIARHAGRKTIQLGDLLLARMFAG